VHFRFSWRKAVAFFRLVKTPEFPRAYPPPPVEPASAERRPEVIIPRYVQAPALRDHGLGPRNLFWGVATLLLAAVLLVVAMFFKGVVVLISVFTCLATFTVLFVLSRLHVFRQRNGGFLALGLVCLIGALVPLVEKAYSSAKDMFLARLSNGPVVALHSSESGTPLLTEFFGLPKPDGDGKQVNVLRDTSVEIAGKAFLVKAGERFPLVTSKGNETTFAVRDLQVSVPSNVVEVIDPKALSKGVAASASQKGQVAPNAANESKTAPQSDADLADITRNAQQEAMRRYPALAMKDSLENAVFVSTYKQLKDSGSNDFFGNPEWPLELAELLAKREGWVRGGPPMTTGPAPVLDAPADSPAPASDSVGAGNPPADPADSAPLLPRRDRDAQ